MTDEKMPGDPGGWCLFRFGVFLLVIILLILMFRETGCFSNPPFKPYH